MFTATHFKEHLGVRVKTVAAFFCPNNQSTKKPANVINAFKWMLLGAVISSVLLWQCAAPSKRITLEDYFSPRKPVDLFAKDARPLWTSAAFDYSGAVDITDSLVTLNRGGYLTGITWTGPVPRMNYEINLDTKRLEGLDFFCGLTFPFGDSHSSLIIGGWGGYTTGISSINGIDASENGTANAILFEENTWYHIRLQVSPQHIQAWVDDRKIVDLDTTGKIIGLRRDVDASIPLSLMTYNTTGAMKNMTLMRF